MNRVSDTAKAVAVRVYCAGVDDYDLAVEVFDALGQSDEPVTEVLDKFGAFRWELLDMLDDAQWWEQLEMLAHGVDAAWDHFEFENKD